MTRFLAFLLMMVLCHHSAAREAPVPLGKQILRGPLRISADETLSTEKGRIIDGLGNVSVRYQTDSEDVFESFSQFAHYDQEKAIGEIWGKPKAVWKRADPSQPSTHLLADKITLLMERAELVASGNVSVTQASTTLKAQQVRFFNDNKKITADGGRPSFNLNQDQQQITITSEKIIAWTDEKRIQFNSKVKGVVEFRNRNEPQR